MVAQPTPDVPQTESCDPLYRLDGIRLTKARAKRVALIIQRLVKELSPEDLAILPHLQACACFLAAPLAGAVESDSNASLAGDHSKPGVTTTLFDWQGRYLPAGHVLTSLTAILVNAALDPDRGVSTVERNHISRLSQIIRGALGAGKNADLLVLLGGSEAIQSLVEHVDAKLKKGKRVHPTFETLWRQWLRDRIAGWTMEEPSRLRHTLNRAVPLTPDLDAPSVDLWFDGMPDAGDESVAISVPVEGEDFVGLNDTQTDDLATALQFLRGNAYGGLTLPADHYAPDELVRAVIKGALSAADRALASSEPARAEPILALTFAVATAIRANDLQDIVWGSSDAPGSLTLDPGRPVLTIKLRQPAHAVSPEGLGGKLEDVTETFEWPVPPSIHKPLRRIASVSSLMASNRVFPGVAARGTGFRLSQVISDLGLGATVSASRIRMALAAKVAARFGPEVAQWLLRDSLFTSLGPAYYCSAPVRCVGEFIAGVQSDWFAESIPVPADTGAFLGSRLALRADAVKEWPARLRKQAYSSARKKGAALESLRTERNRLAATLCAATGNRPGNSLGFMHLNDVIPEYGLVILQDKREDMLRRTRVAATGKRWLGTLRTYLDTVAELSHGHDPNVATWAADVLQNKQPLFSLPNGELLDGAALRATMPSALVAVDNFYRHRLNQALQSRRVDWELRHAQLGWVVSPAFALADLSPVSPQILAEVLGPFIDDVLVEDGWYSGHERVGQWPWRDIPMPALADWPSIKAEYEAGDEEATRATYQSLVLHRKEVEPIVLSSLSRAVRSCTPRLQVEVDGRTLLFAEGRAGRGPVPLTPEHYALLKDYVRQDLGERFSPVHGIVAEELIHELVVQAVRGKIAAGPEPVHHRIGFTSQLSPFLPGIGLAVRHAMEIRARLQQIASQNLQRDRAGVVQLSILAHTPYRDLHRSELLFKAASRVVRGASHPAWLRVPARDQKGEIPMVLGGIAAAALARCGQETPTMRPLTSAKLAAWLVALLEGGIPLPADPATLPSTVAETLRVAGLIELDGPGRLVMDDYPSAAVSTDREVAENEAWPATTGSVAGGDSERSASTKEVTPNPPSHRSVVDAGMYERLTRILNPDVVSSEKKSRGQPTSNRRGWRQQMDRELRKLLGDVGHDPNLGLIVQYTLHGLRYGGKRVKHFQEGTLHHRVTLFARPLLGILAGAPLLALPSDRIEAKYLAVLCGKNKDGRADVLEEIVKFHHYLVFVHHAPEVEFARLRTFAGPRVRRADKGTLTRPEIELILAELEADVRREKESVDAGPEAIRACELRVILFLLLEATALRPKSCRGLLLGDLHLFGSGRDFVHVHTSGGYGSAKTSTSKGFVPCEGEVWAEHRERVVKWIESERGKLGADWWKLPLFGDATGSRRNYAQDFLTTRISVLARWASGSKSARTYWLRKRRMTQRLRAVMDAPTPSAASMFRALHESGEADILTPISNYIHDAAVPARTFLDTSGRPDRAGVLAVTGLPAGPLDMRWHKRRDTDDVFFFSAVFDTLGIAFETPREGKVSEAPMLFRQRPLLPMHIDRYARALQRLENRNEAMAKCGLSDVQADTLDQGVRQMVIRNGRAPWLLPDIRERSALMHASRRLDGTEKLFGLLEQSPLEWLLHLESAWLRNSYISRLHAPDVEMVLQGAAECGAATTLLERTGIHLHFEKTGSHAGVLRAIGSKEGSAYPRGKRHGYALRWVLAICWLHHYLASSSDVDLGAVSGSTPS